MLRTILILENTGFAGSKIQYWLNRFTFLLKVLEYQQAFSLLELCFMQCFNPEIIYYQISLKVKIYNLHI